MAVNFLNNREVSDLCLGKPSLRWVSVGATVSDTLLALKRSGETHISVWSCSADHSSKKGSDCTNEESLPCRCVGKICMVDVISFLCKDENIVNPFKALEAPISQILIQGAPSTVRHLEPNSSLLQAIDYILEGTQNLVIPIENYVTRNSRKKFLNKPPPPLSCTLHNGRDYCWITQEDVLRFLLNSIGVFSPIPTFTIESLNMIDHDIMTVHYDEPATSMLSCISRSLAEQSSVAVIDENGRLIGEISPSTLACCDETVAAAIATLSAGDLMAYIDCGGPPEDLVQLVKMRLEEKHLDAMGDLLELYDQSTSSLPSPSSSSSEDESALSKYGGASGRHSPGRRSEAIMCYPWSSLVAVMIQALAHRVSCIWVVEEDHTLVGHVTFEGMLKVFRSISGTRQTINRGCLQTITNDLESRN